MSRARCIAITLACLFGISLSALEITVVGTVAPLVVRDLGGFDSYAWIFTIYLLTCSISMPFWGRAADHWGRKPIFMTCMVLFLIGSVLCGVATSFEWLIAARAIKGLGGGGLVPLAFTIITDIFDVKTRTKMQAVISAVWAVSGLIGPFLGGVFADTVGWRWVFYFNLIPGSIAFVTIGLSLKEAQRCCERLQLSVQSFLCSVLFVVCLLSGLHQVQRQSLDSGLLLLIVALLTFVLFFVSEKHARYPLIPQALLKNKIFKMSCLTGFLFSALLIGFASFIPLLFQIIWDYSAMASGLMLMPLTVSWVLGTVVSTRLILLYPYRRLLVVGFTLTFTGLFFFMQSYDHLTLPLTIISTAMMGFGMSFNYPVVLLTTQYDVEKNMIGFATSALFWVRNIGSTVGMGLMGIAMMTSFNNQLSGLQLGEPMQSLAQSLIKSSDRLLSPQILSQIKLDETLFQVLQNSIFWALMILMGAVTLAVLCLPFFPKKLASHNPIRS